MWLQIVCTVDKHGDLCERNKMIVFTTVIYNIAVKMRNKYVKLARVDIADENRGYVNVFEGTSK